MITNTSPAYDYVPQSQYPLFPKPSIVGKAPSIDFVFVNGYIEQLYFAFECKLIDFQDNRLVMEYIQNGMYRFISGYYSNNTFDGGMLGYTFNTNIQQTVEKINLKINQRSDMSSFDCIERDDGSLIYCDYLYKSKHIRLSDGQLFTIKHLFLTFT